MRIIMLMLLLASVTLAAESTLITTTTSVTCYYNEYTAYYDLCGKTQPYYSVFEFLPGGKLIKHTNQEMTSIYVINSTEQEEDEDTYTVTFLVTSDVGNNYMFMLRATPSGTLISTTAYDRKPVTENFSNIMTVK